MGTDRGGNRERGSALILMPVAVLVLLILAAIAVDQSMLFNGQRELADAAQAAANDAAGAGLDVDAFYTGDRVRFDLDTARAVATRSLALRGITEPPTITVDSGGNRVVVVVRARVKTVFASGLPGGSDGREVSARATPVWSTAEPTQTFMLSCVVSCRHGYGMTMPVGARNAG